KRAAIVIGGLPDAAFRRIHGLAILADQWIEPAVLRIALIVLDELPLPLVSLEIGVVLRSVLFVHEEQRIEAFGLNPPLFVADFGLAVGPTLVIETAEILIPSICERMIHEHSRHALGARIVAIVGAAVYVMFIAAASRENIFRLQHQI